jgi:hypothetical protein
MKIRSARNEQIGYAEGKQRANQHTPSSDPV